VAKFEYGMIPGYKSTDLTYAGDLIANVGESLTSVLDKVRNMLGNFEYFYDINGKFIFRKKLNYVTTPWNSSESDNEVVVDAISNINAKIFSFMNGHLITSFSNTPNLLNLRNDFSVWGKYKSITGNELPIHMRYAVNKKPIKYIPIRPLKSLIVTTKNTVGMSYTNTEIKYFDGPGLIPYDDLHLIEGETIIEKDSISNTTISTTNYYLDPDFPMTSKDYDWRELLY